MHWWVWALLAWVLVVAPCVCLLVVRTVRKADEKEACYDADGYCLTHHTVECYQ